MSRLKIFTVIGARPQFIKAAPISAAFASAGMDEKLIHTGQHFDPGMSDIFFEELGIPQPAWHLGLGGKSHGEMTGAMLTEIEKILLTDRPDWVLVYGDTNSTLAGALAAAKLHIPVAHVEAGLRSFNKKMPEEVNRICTDHISTLLFCPSEVSAHHLKNENITQGVHIVGDVMEDAFLSALGKVKANPAKYQNLIPQDTPYILMTIHRAENTNDLTRLQAILKGLEASPIPIIFPVHPRTVAVLKQHGLSLPPQIKTIEPVGYLEMVALLHHAQRVVTDSGGLQKEAYWAAKPCLTLRDETEWTETVKAGWNILAGADTQMIQQSLSSFSKPSEHPALYGEPGASVRIASIMADNTIKN
jgi:UDP-GlcNAc3NAcA epimerase